MRRFENGNWRFFCHHSLVNPYICCLELEANSEFWFKLESGSTHSDITLNCTFSINHPDRRPLLCLHSFIFLLRFWESIHDMQIFISNLGLVTKSPETAFERPCRDIFARESGFNLFVRRASNTNCCSMQQVYDPDFFVVTSKLFKARRFSGGSR